MEDAPILLIFLIIYLITASSGNKKKKKKRPLREGERRRQGTMRTEAQGEQMDWRSILRTEQANEGFYEAFDAHQQSELCDDQPIHLHEVSQAQMVQAGEGKDPCHAGGYTHGGEPEQEVSALSYSSINKTTFFPSLTLLIASTNLPGTFTLSASLLIAALMFKSSNSSAFPVV